MRRLATGSTARSASSRAITPSGLGSAGSPNITGVGNSFSSSLMIVLPTSTGTTLPSANSEWAERSTGTPSRSNSAGHRRKCRSGIHHYFKILKPLTLRVSDSYGNDYGSHYISPLNGWFGNLCGSIS